MNFLRSYSYCTEFDAFQVSELEKKETAYDAKTKSDDGQSQAKLGNFFGETKPKHQAWSKTQLRKLAIFVASTSVPFSIIDTSEFAEFCRSLVPNFKLPDKKTVLSEITDVYTKMRKNILTEIAAARKICLCVDEWTKKGMNWSVIGVTAHFFNPKTHQMERILLGMPRFEHPHTAERISETIDSILRHWEIAEKKIWRIITDNAKNITKAFRTVASDGEDYQYDAILPTARPIIKSPFLEDEDEEFDEDAIDEYLDDTELMPITFDRHEHLPCFIHTLVLAYKKAVNSEESEVLEAIRDCRRLVRFFAKSSKATERLKEISGRKLLMPARTRWNYHYEMIKRLVESRKDITQVCEEQLINNLKNWGILVQFTDVLEPFAKWIDYLQSQKYSTIVYALPCLKELLAHLKDKADSGILPKLCDDIIFQLNDYFKYILSMDDITFNPTFLVATSLHPFLARSLKDTIEEPQLYRARQEIQNLLRAEFEVSSSTGQTAMGAMVQQGESARSFCGGLFPHLEKEILGNQANGMLSSISIIEDELNLYFKQIPNYPLVENPLQFWVDSSAMFPNLSKLACDLLTIPASSSAVESVFSVSGHATSGRRHNLTVNLEKEVMIKVNKKFL